MCLHAHRSFSTFILAVCCKIQCFSLVQLEMKYVENTVLIHMGGWGGGVCQQNVASGENWGVDLFSV